MDVLHVADSYLPTLGGIELHLRDLIAHQRAGGVDARLLTATPSALDPGAEHVVAGERAVDPPWVYRATTGRHHPSTQAASTCARRLISTQRPTVLHAHISLFSPFAVLAVREALDLGVPTVVTAHSMWDGLGPLPWLTRSVLGLRRWPVTWSAVSGRAADSLVGLLGPEIPVHVVPNAIDVGYWGPPAAVTSPAASPTTAVSVMRLTTLKRTLPLARMLREVHEAVPQARALIVGDGPQRRPLERYLRQHRMREWVELPGRLHRDEIRRRIGSAAFFVAPAHRETFGIAALEARTLGLPVVASSHSGVREFITHDVEGLLAADDTAMCEHMVRLLTAESLRTRIVEHNRRVAPVHDWPGSCAAAHQLYGIAAARAAARRPRPPDTGGRARELAASLPDGAHR